MAIQSKPIKSIDYNEIFFVTINGYTNYQISPNGDVKNIKTNKILKPFLRRDYYCVRLCKNGIVKNKYIHQLVADAFLDKPNENSIVDHINNIKTDNRLENLRLVTQSENTRNKSKHYNVNYQFVNEIPSNSLHITQFKDNDITDIGLYFNKQTNDFYLKTADNKYKIMYKNKNGNSYQIRFRFKDKQINYSPKQMKRNYPDYFN